MLNVDEKVIISTGASSDIGEASAKLLAQHGAKLDRFGKLDVLLK